MGFASVSSRIGANLKSYIIVKTTDVSSVGATLSLKYFENGVLLDEKSILFSEHMSKEAFHFIYVWYFNGWNVESGEKSVYKASVYDRTASFDSEVPIKSETWQYQETVENVYGQPNLNWEKVPPKVYL